MTNSFLSWDDFAEEDIQNTGIADVKDKDIAAKAINTLNNLNSEEVLVEIGKTLIPEDKILQKPIPLPKGDQGAWLRAQKVIQEMDTLLEHGGRVTVGDKRMLNCQADLNQLVPFKYNWAWSLYLTSTEHHWMPGELMLENALAEMNTHKKGTPRQLLYRFFESFRVRQSVYNPSILLTCYRLITNPEYRQYILRQAFETSVINHVLVDLDSLFDFKNMKADNVDIARNVSIIDGRTFITRCENLHNLTRNLKDENFTTTTNAGLNEFVKSIIYLNGYGNWLYNITPMYQMLNYCKINNQLEPISNLIKFMLRDMITQMLAVTNFLTTAIDENQVFGEGIDDEFKTAFKTLINGELDLASTYANTDIEYAEISTILNYLYIKFFNDIGITDQQLPKVEQGARWFLELIESLTPEVNNEGSASGGTLGW